MGTAATISQLAPEIQRKLAGRREALAQLSRCLNWMYLVVPHFLPFMEDLRRVGIELSLTPLSTPAMSARPMLAPVMAPGPYVAAAPVPAPVPNPMPVPDLAPIRVAPTPAAAAGNNDLPMADSPCSPCSPGQLTQLCEILGIGEPSGGHMMLLSNALSASQDKLSAAHDSLASLEAAYTRLDGEYASLSAVNVHLGNNNVLLRAELEKKERQLRVSQERTAELTSYARGLEQYWTAKLACAVGQYVIAVRAAVAVGAFARLLNVFNETPVEYNLEDPASIDRMITTAAALVYRFTPKTYPGSVMHRFLRPIRISIDPREFVISRVPHYADQLSGDGHALMQPFYLATRHAVSAGTEATRHLAHTAASMVPEEGVEGSVPAPTPTVAAEAAPAAATAA
ncbi:hypothetical protein HYH02_015010 [Chlamydomonas schloesseri]|uniref:Uncharacterized protein n=1 Tax=Chlamydomonas schloesseri TaxID=2026947 RepID=A0A835SRW2_9CHLO|nr:hypothetical protein HYH02_015010 [Chlamydomonas schloesseri]|eukprot:KAG2425525.1 hypothetical protein HYH02_015010 [Chlamydomonas schloesseri]